MNRSRQAWAALFRASMIVLAVIGACWLALPKPPLLDGVPYSREIRDRRGTLLRLTLAADDKYRIHVPLREISPELREAVLIHEDKYYYAHHGANPVSLAKAAWNECFGPGSRFGGSTLSMQVARVRYGLRTRTIRGKLIQIFRAVQLERHYSKEEILEAYFTLAPYGSNVEGAGAASLIYFGKTPDRVSLPEALALSVIPQHPSARGPKRGSDGMELRAARRRVFEEWVARHPQDERRRRDFDSRVQAGKPGDLPFAAPHFVEEVLAKKPSAESDATTLDARLQRRIERVAQGYLAARKDEGLKNASVLLVDWRSRDIVAEFGSRDYFDRSIAGQVNGTASQRSPGSTLKPFVYALALDQGLIHPLSQMRDLPGQLASYDPENFDRQFAGVLPARDALVQSRNVPAVALAGALKGRTLWTLLRDSGVANLRGEESYGLALALGACEISPQELASLYSMLADGGRFLPLRRLLNEPIPKPARVLSPEAAFLTLEMLRDSPAPESADPFDAMWRDRGVAWKTGTSFGCRDAWTAGVFGRFVLVVWIGNFDGGSNPAFTGRGAALPLFRAVADELRDAAGPRFADGPPPRLRKVELCPDSGDLKGARCPRSVSGWFIPGVSPIRACAVHRKSPSSDEVREVFDSEVRAASDAAGLPLVDSTVSDVAPSGMGARPRMVLPRDDATYCLESEASLPLLAEADGEVRKLYWFAGSRFVGSSRPGETFLWRAAAGPQQLRVVDDRGRADCRRIEVQRSMAAPGQDSGPSR